MEPKIAARDAASPERIQLFSYPASSHEPATPEWQSWMDPDSPSPGEDSSHNPAGKPAPQPNADFEKQLAEESRRSFEAGRERGRQEGRQAERESIAAAHKAAEEQRSRQRAELLQSFAQERDRYLQAVEHEVVKLSLAVAARILRREAQMDPLLLTGAVRVALGQLARSTEVRLRVPAADIGLWTDSIALLPNLALKPALLSDDTMRLGDCVVETSLGSVDLGIRSQLAEIERGFFDRAGSSPSSAHQSTEPAARMAPPAGEGQ
jgi:flagellar assembly protein FliH